MSKIAIVGRGCILPGAKNIDEFRDILYKQECQIEPIHKNRWKEEIFFNPDSEECKSYSNLAAQVSLDIVEEINRKYGLTKKYDTRLISYVVDSYAQVLKSVKNFESDNIDIPVILGCMNPDVRFLEEHVYKFYLDRKEDLKNHPADLSYEKLLEIHDEMLKLSPYDISSLHDESIFQTYVFKKLSEIFKETNSGRGFLVDAACASSLSSLDIACNQLLTGRESLVIAGGVESNLSVGTFVVFSRVGALAKSTDIKPLDKNSGGMIQGEGCTLFALERLEDAIKNGREIYGVIEGVSGSSDGRSASLFQPTQKGQEIAYDRVWRNRKEKPFFIEAHATGTNVGDLTESSSISSYFSGQNIHVGAIKGLFGHTKGNAGAISVLKSTLILEEKNIPGNGPIEESRFDASEFVVNKKNEQYNGDSNSVGISSFGFGGCNYHLSLSKNDKLETLVESPCSNNNPIKISVIKQSEVLIKDIDLNDLKYFPFPPNSISNIDVFQIAAIKAVKDLSENIDTLLESLGKKDINVVSAGKLGLNKNIELVDRVVNNAVIERVSALSDSAEKSFYLDFVRSIFESNIKLSEDIGPGILNNVIAGRVSNVFDLHGKNYHIDKDFDSFNAALYTIGLELEIDPSRIFIVIDTTGEYSSSSKKYKESKVDAYLVTHDSNVQAIGLGKVSEVEIERL